MITYKCKMCGGDLRPEENAAICECEFCGTVQTVPAADSEKKAQLFNRANRLRMNAEFDKAAVYESIAAEFPEEAEAYWGLCLCAYGIEYVDDPATGEKKPTCHRTLPTSIMEDGDFEQACDNADAAARRVYREEAKAIDRLQKAILDVVRNEKPYSIKKAIVTWENSTIREWLNREFLNQAFTKTEQTGIPVTKVDNSSYQGFTGWDTNGGNNTEDKVFLLSAAEVKKYLGVTVDDSNNRKSRVAPTAYALNAGAWTSGRDKTADGSAAGWWWLRSPGGNQNSAATVYGDGSLYYNSVISNSSCVRPALWIDLDSEVF